MGHDLPAESKRRLDRAFFEPLRAPANGNDQRVIVKQSVGDADVLDLENAAFRRADAVHVQRHLQPGTLLGNFIQRHLAGVIETVGHHHDCRRQIAFLAEQQIMDRIGESRTRFVGLERGQHLIGCTHLRPVDPGLACRVPQSLTEQIGA